MKAILFLILGLGVVRGSIVSVDVYQNDEGWNYHYQTSSENLNSFTIILPEGSHVEQCALVKSTNAIHTTINANRRYIQFQDLQFNSLFADFILTTSVPPTKGMIIRETDRMWYRQDAPVPAPESKIILLTILGMIFKPRKRK